MDGKQLLLDASNKYTTQNIIPLYTDKLDGKVR